MLRRWIRWFRLRHLRKEAQLRREYLSERFVEGVDFIPICGVEYLTLKGLIRACEIIEERERDTMIDQVAVQIGTRQDPEQLDFILNYTKREGEKIAKSQPSMVWTSGPSGGCWSTTDKPLALSLARTAGQMYIRNNVTGAIVFECPWVKL